jgi:hypothetical protein
VGTVRSAALLGGLVDLDVLYDEGTGVEALGISVGLGVLEETEEELGGLDGPAGLGDTELLSCTWQTQSANKSLSHKMKFLSLSAARVKSLPTPILFTLSGAAWDFSG